MSLFLGIFAPSFIAVFSLQGEYVVRFSLPNGVFCLVTTGWDFFTSAYYVRIQSINQIMQGPRQPHVVLRVSSFFPFVLWIYMSLFLGIFAPSFIAVFSLQGEYVVRFSLPDGVFLPCDHGLDFFLHQLIMWEFNQSTKKICCN